jgi:tetratricopeptide (TPR) repeat protein
MTITARRSRLVVVLLLFAGAAGLGWYHFLAPPLPSVPLEGKDAPVQEAVGQALSQVRWHPRSGAAWGHLGQVLHIHSFPAQADYSYKQAERFDPTNPRWPYLRGVLCLPDAQAALPHLQKAADLCDRFDAGNTAPRLKLAQALLAQGRTTEATEQLERVIDDEPGNSRAHYHLGLLALADNRPETAVGHLLLSQRSPFARKKSCFQLAMAYRALGQSSETPTEARAGFATLADEYSKQAAAAPEDKPWIDPYLHEINLLTAGRSYYFQIAGEMQQQGRLLEAIALMEQVVQQFPDDDSYIELTQLLIAAKEHARAEQAARQTLKLRPDKVQGHYYLGESLFRQGLHIWNTQPAERATARAKFQEAEEHLRTATELMPIHPLAHVYRGRCLRYLDRHADAAGAFRAALRHNPRQAEAYVFLSNLLAEDGKKLEARAVLEEGRKALPENGDIRRALERLGTPAP